MENFIKVYGSSEPEAIAAALNPLCQTHHLENTITLHKQDVTTLTPEQLCRFSQSPYRAVLVDCAKLPVVMQSVMNLIAMPDVVGLGTTIFFEDMFDWHAPWNLYALWQMIERGNGRVAYLGKRVGPLLEVTGFNSMDGLIEYDDPSPVGDAWAKRFADVDSELKAIDHFQEMTSGFVELRWKTQCLRAGALLRANRVGEAEKLVSQLDATWPVYVGDTLLQEAYIRLRHFQTGIKDKSLRTPNHQARATWPFKRLAEAMRYRWPVL